MKTKDYDRPGAQVDAMMLSGNAISLNNLIESPPACRMSRFIWLLRVNKCLLHSQFKAESCKLSVAEIAD